MFPLRDNIRSRTAPAMTWLIIALNCAMFFIEASLPGPRLERLVGELGMIPARLGEDPAAWTTLVTSVFLHGGWLHLLSNMWMLYLFGDNVEDRMGKARYLVFYLACGVAAGLAHWAFAPRSPVPVVGASGAIAGVLGAYFLLYPRARVLTLIPIFIYPLFVEVPAVLFLGLWFASQLFQGTVTVLNPHLFSPVAFWAHAGGFVAGMALLPAFVEPPANRRSDV
ncbi:MAG TPA: rhomboid family intramembrane serine protease [Lacipirellulaceae bacterium]|nr:rhomboid family intramembrane serine protease [Lacipirellulaceae bacterium]